MFIYINTVEVFLSLNFLEKWTFCTYSRFVHQGSQNKPYINVCLSVYPSVSRWHLRTCFCSRFTGKRVYMIRLKTISSVLYMRGIVIGYLELSYFFEEVVGRSKACFFTFMNLFCSLFTRKWERNILSLFYTCVWRLKATWDCDISFGKNNGDRPKTFFDAAIDIFWALFMGKNEHQLR